MFQNKKYILMTASMGLRVESVSGASMGTWVSAWGNAFTTQHGKPNSWDVQTAIYFVSTTTKQQLFVKKDVDPIKGDYLVYKSFLELYNSKFLSQRQQDCLEGDKKDLEKLEDRMEVSVKFRTLYKAVFKVKDTSFLRAFIRVFEALSQNCQEHIVGQIYRSTHFNNVVLKCLPRFAELKREGRKSEKPLLFIKALKEDLRQYSDVPMEYKLNFQAVAKAFMAEKSEILRLVRQGYSDDLNKVWSSLKDKMFVCFKSLNPSYDFWSRHLYTAEEQTDLVNVGNNRRWIEEEIKDLFWTLDVDDEYPWNGSRYQKHEYSVLCELRLW